MLYASTSEVYGDPEEHPQTESYNGNVNIRGPRSCYDESKRFGETLVDAYEQKYDIDVRTVRIFNTYGPRMRQDDGRVVPTFVRQALSGDDLTVYGDGTQTRSFCFVDDLIVALQKVMEEDNLSGSVFNVGSQQEVSIKTLAELIIELTGSESRVVFEPLPSDDPQHRQPDLSRINHHLGWNPTTSLRSGLKQTIPSFE
jgi:UDP-glucuronate decarboxylase